MNATAPAKPVRVIVADDHEWILQILSEVVQDTLPMAQVIAVEDGKQALEAYQREGCHFLVTNHHMPHMDGATLIRNVRAQAPALPIVMVSSKPEVKAEALAAGADWFLTKEQITEQLPRLLRQHTPAQTRSATEDRSRLFDPGAAVEHPAAIGSINLVSINYTLRTVIS